MMLASSERRQRGNVRHLARMDVGGEDAAAAGEANKEGRGPHRGMLGVRAERTGRKDSRKLEEIRRADHFQTEAAALARGGVRGPVCYVLESLVVDEGGDDRGHSSLFNTN